VFVLHWSGCLYVFGVKRWVGISEQGRDVDCAMDRVGENLAIVRSVLLPSAYLLLDQRDKVELRGC